MRRFCPVALASLCLIFGPSAAGQQPAAAPDKVRVVVPGVHAYAGVDPGVDGVLTDLLLEALLTRHGVRALGPPDLRAILSAEQQRLLLGCQDEACFVELAGALGADWLVAGSLGRLGSLHVVSLQLIDPKQARVAARASVNLDRIEAASAAIGPLVDRLLGAQPRAQAPAALAEPAEAPPKPAMDLRTHCKRADDYFKRLLQGPWSPELVEARRELLTDQVATAFFQQFDQKTNCFWNGFNGADSNLRTDWLLSKNEAVAIDALRRHLEVLVFRTQVKLLEEEVPRRLEMEKLGTGRRLAAVPFPVAAAEIPAPADSQPVRAYLGVFAATQPVINQALAAIRAKDPKAFGALFAPDVDEKVRAVAFQELSKRLEQGFELDACPRYLFDADEIEQNAEWLAERGQFRGCLRRAKQRFIITQRLILRLVDGVWRMVSF